MERCAKICVNKKETKIDKWVMNKEYIFFGHVGHGHGSWYMDIFFGHGGFFVSLLMILVLNHMGAHEDCGSLSVSEMDSYCLSYDCWMSFFT